MPETKYRPLHDVVVIRRDKALTEEEMRTEAGLITGTEAAAKVPQRGTVIAVGPGKTADGVLVEPSCKNGDRVVFGRFDGFLPDDDDDELLFLRDSQIYAVIEEL